MSEADRARRNEAAWKIDSAIDAAGSRLRQFSEEIRSYGDARSHSLVLEVVNLARAEVNAALTTVRTARLLDREFPGFLPRALQELPSLEEEYHALNKAATDLLAKNERREREDQAKWRRAQQEREERAARQREERAAAAATAYAPVSVARQQSDTAAHFRKPDADLRPPSSSAGSCSWAPRSSPCAAAAAPWPRPT